MTGILNNASESDNKQQYFLKRNLQQLQNVDTFAR